jgi:2-polyprenyl-6-methoxyphenol hydroxylase-like FAD-dependent oxidoreductase
MTTQRVVIVSGANGGPTSPNAGQGASLAEDALVVAKCLRDIPDIGHALTTGDEER